MHIIRIYYQHLISSTELFDMDIYLIKILKLHSQPNNRFYF